jgi:NADH-quinone oxidoreductase subunit N
VLQAVIELGYVWLAVVAVLLSLIGVFYYLRVVKLMYFDAPHDSEPVAAGAGARTLLSANGLAMLVLGILPQSLMAVCMQAIGTSL